jgi:hypothetical protein
MEISDLTYAKIANDVLKFVLRQKSLNSTLSIVDLITSYCFKMSLEPELVGDAISQDFYFKQLIEKDIRAKESEDW